MRAVRKSCGGPQNRDNIGDDRATVGKEGCKYSIVRGGHDRFRPGGRGEKKNQRKGSTHKGGREEPVYSRGENFSFAPTSSDVVGIE